MNTYRQIENDILNIPKFAGKHSVADTRKLLEKVTGDSMPFKIIHVAGTNGKGSVCTYLKAILEAAGYRTGIFTSPHLVTMRERICIGDSMISEEEFVAAYEKVREAGGQPSFFEMLFLMAMVYFKEQAPDYLILETGLGGRLDATNAVPQKDLAVITHMGLDHTEYLGNTLTEIAREKAGIMQEGTPVVYWETDADVAGMLAECAKNLQIPAFPVSKCDYAFLKNSNKGIDFSYRSLYYDSIRLHMNTIAGYQMENATLAVRALEVMFGREGLPRETIRKGIEAAFWPGRMEEILPDVYVDGAHNEDGVRAFLETVSGDGCQSGRCLLFGVVGDKAYEDMIKEIAEGRLFDRICVVQMKSPRALDADKISAVFERYTGRTVKVYRSAREAFTELIAGKRDGERIYIAGSLYLVGEIKELRSL